ncbi:MAG: hypothetical protein JOY64_13280 [Alphaproteobacteria bacterium]|nr:hypothetical protein [Alphaproteobacteria bacterium]MBV8408601.1 hypothetical protein [Alphaproteobacteria bacterium]
MSLALNTAKDGDGSEVPDPAKLLVMAELARLVEDGGATMRTLKPGLRELRLSTGEVFHLGSTAVTRIA